MIREQLLLVRERRALLVARAEHQREVMHALVVRAESATAWFDRARGLVAGALARPVWIAAGVALFVALRPRRSLKLLATGVSLWRGWHGLRAAIERMNTQPPARGA